MSAIISAESPDQPDAALLVAELQTHLESFYPPESRHGFSVDRLIAEGVAFFVLRVDGEAAGCGGIKIVDREYGELKRMYVRPQYRGKDYGAMILNLPFRLRAQSRNSSAAVGNWCPPTSRDPAI